MQKNRPRNFSWVIDGLLAGCAFPSQPGHFRFLVDYGVRHLVTLTDFTPPLHLLPKELKFYHLPIREFDAPSVQQMRKVCDIVCQAREKYEGVTVHCHWGLGRTGTVLAACLVALEGLGPDDAIKQVRNIRPFSIETYEQEDAVRDFARALPASVEKKHVEHCDDSDEDE